MLIYKDNMDIVEKNLKLLFDINGFLFFLNINDLENDEENKEEKNKEENKEEKNKKKD